uniref:Peptidase S1 domain-containing protein n=1 Tax=Anopheles atroparvus TaxID=41427 RepID=A0AAG5DRV8_ANOAO
MFGVVIGLACFALGGGVYAKDGNDAEGVPPSGRIVGGQDADIRDHPHMLLLHKDGEAICGAVVIGSNYAITAAHCVYPLLDLRTFTLHGGSTTQLGMNTTFYASSVHIHPKYDDPSLDNDVAIIGINGTFTGHPNITAIPLQNTDPIISSSRPTDCYTTGWGVKNRKMRTIPNRLQIGYLQLVPSRTCRIQWYPNAITPSMICAQGDSTDACSGDSGGPLVCDGRLYGTVSWGTRECNGSRAAVFAKIPATTIRSFISAITGI